MNEPNLQQILDAFTAFVYDGYDQCQMTMGAMDQETVSLMLLNSLLFNSMVAEHLQSRPDGMTIMAEVMSSMFQAAQEMRKRVTGES